MKKQSGSVIYSPSDLIRFLESPFASWMDRFHLENPDALSPDEDSEDKKLTAQIGDQHEGSVLERLKPAVPSLIEIPKCDFAVAKAETLSAIKSKAPIISQPALEDGQFAGYADFLIPHNQTFIRFGT
jgi:hypothetical protein